MTTRITRRHFAAALVVASVFAGATLPALAAGGGFDSDYDGLSDQAEVELHGTDPFNADTDFDGLSDGLEWNLPSNPLYPDTDGDGYDDGYEYLMGTDLLNADDFPVFLGQG